VTLSPGDLAGRLLVALHVVHGAVPVAKGVHAHEVPAAASVAVSTAVVLVVEVVLGLVGLVEVGEGRHHVGQSAQVALTRVVLGRGDRLVCVCVCVCVWRVLLPGHGSSPCDYQGVRG